MGKCRFKSRRKQWVRTTAKLLGYRILDNEKNWYRFHIYSPNGEHLGYTDNPQMADLGSSIKVEADIYEKYGLFFNKARIKAIVKFHPALASTHPVPPASQQ